jgi:hypothetical protein
MTAWTVLVIAAACAALIALLAWASVRSEQDCHARGGVIHCTTSSGYTFGRNGGSPTTLTTCDCYWPDGRVLVR